MLACPECGLLSSCCWVAGELQSRVKHYWITHSINQIHTSTRQCSPLMGSHLQGIILPTILASHGSLEKKLLLSGNTNRVLGTKTEFWSAHSWSLMGLNIGWPVLEGSVSLDCQSFHVQTISASETWHLQCKIASSNPGVSPHNVFVLMFVLFFFFSCKYRVGVLSGFFKFYVTAVEFLELSVRYLLNNQSYPWMLDS